MKTITFTRDYRTYKQGGTLRTTDNMARVLKMLGVAEDAPHPFKGSEPPAAPQAGPDDTPPETGQSAAAEQGAPASEGAGEPEAGQTETDPETGQEAAAEKGQDTAHETAHEPETATKEPEAMLTTTAAITERKPQPAKPAAKKAASSKKNKANPPYKTRQLRAENE